MGSIYSQDDIKQQTKASKQEDLSKQEGKIE
jgi:hypothetical protein